MSAPVHIWLTRNKVGDFKVSVQATEDGFHVRVRDDNAEDRYMSEFDLETFDQLITYLDTLCHQALNDKDQLTPFTHFQYCIPNFPTVIAPLRDLADDEFYGRFSDAMSFYYL